MHVYFTVASYTPAEKVFDDYVTKCVTARKALLKLMKEYKLPPGPLLKKSDYRPLDGTGWRTMQEQAANGWGWKMGRRRPFGFVMQSVRVPGEWCLDHQLNRAFLATSYGDTGRTYGDYLRYDKDHGCMVPTKKTKWGEELQDALNALPAEPSQEDMANLLLKPRERPTVKNPEKPTQAEERELNKWRSTGFYPMGDRRLLVTFRFMTEPIGGVIQASRNSEGRMGTWLVGIPAPALSDPYAGISDPAARSDFGLLEPLASDVALALAAQDRADSGYTDEE